MSGDASSSERLLVLAPTGRDAELAAAVLAGGGLVVHVCRSAAELCAEAARGAGVVLVTEEALSADAVERLAACVAAQEAWSDLPVIVFATRAPHEQPAVAEPLAGLGNLTVVDRPLRRRTLLSVARTALRARRRQYAAREVLTEVREAVRQRDAFLALLGHELRNPLAAVEAAGELLERGADPGRPLAILRRQTRQLTRLVDDLLDVSRVTSGKVVLQPTTLDLAEAARRTVESHDAEAQRAGVELTAADDAPVHVRGDAARVEQILSNLVSNAVKYTPRGGHVRVSTAREGDRAVLRVRDDGIGIAAEDLGRIFTPFVQLASALDHARGGMGLGLTLVRSLVEMHGGDVEARSAGRGQGTEIVARLPAVAPPAQRGAGRSGRGVCPARDVLVVEDNDDVRSTFADVLAHYGHRVRAAADGPSGLALAREQPPDVAFVDIGLPGIDGFEVARRLRAEHGPRPLLVALSGYGQEEDRALALAAGFDVHVTKPVDPDRLDELLARDRP